jgi:amino acid transporter
VSITQDESSHYLAKRTLKRGSAGWLLLAGFGVSYVISGDYSGWNFGLAEGGFGGLLIAVAVIAGMYLALVIYANSRQLFALSRAGQGAMLLNMAVFGAALSYVLMMVSRIVLRVREPGMPRPYRTHGGIATTSFAALAAAEEELE